MPDSVDRIGPWRLLRELGSGGMGRVWLAERSDGQYQQQVAIKVLKRGMDSDEILRRFRIERQILADLAHPNIARLLDGGLTQDGLPYLVLEYVDGQPIDDYCRARNLSLQDTLVLHMAVCDAVHYAHQRLLIHRDLKPANILVGADGLPKLLDFGIAKLLHPDGTDLTQQMTAQQPLMLTPRYASPEQIRGEPITTASDVYALGCLLYELLSGQSPYQSSLENPVQLLRDVCLTEPPRPSVALTAFASAGKAGERPWSSRALQGDLDNIVMMALRKEPHWRYSSVAHLRADLGRYLDSEPVTARPSTLGYRTGKILRRNPLAASAVAIAALSLLGATAVSLWQTRIARQERAKAEQRLDDVRRLANTMIFDVNAELENGPTKARGVLVDRALQYLEALSQQDALAPGLKRDLAAAYEKIGDIEGNYTVINQLGRSANALKHYQRALTLRRELVREQPDNADYRADLASSFQTLGDMSWSAADTAQAQTYYGKAVSTLESLVVRNPDNVEWQIALARARNYLANVLYSQSRPSLLRYADSMALHRRAADAVKAVRDRHPDSAGLRYQLEGSLYEIGSKLLSAGRAGEATPSLQQAVSLTREWIAAEPDNARAQRTLGIDMKKLAEALAEGGDLPGSITTMQDALAIRETLAASDASNAGWQRDLAVGHYALADWLARSGQHAAALPHLERALAIHQSLFARDSSNLVRRTDLAEVGNLLGEVQLQLKQAAAAAMTMANVRTLLETTPAGQHSAQLPELTASAIAVQSQIAAARGDVVSAARLAQSAVDALGPSADQNGFNAYALRDRARLQLQTAQFLQRCVAKGPAVDCGPGPAQACDHARDAARHLQLLASEGRLAPDYRADLQQANGLVSRCTP